MSICLPPQVGAKAIVGIIDLNGKNPPNVLNRDLRTFTLEAKTRVGLSQDTEAIKTTECAVLPKLIQFQLYVTL